MPIQIWLLGGAGVFLLLGLGASWLEIRAPASHQRILDNLMKGLLLTGMILFIIATARV